MVSLLLCNGIEHRIAAAFLKKALTGRPGMIIMNPLERLPER
jgi:hypothetical protein